MFGKDDGKREALDIIRKHLEDTRAKKFGPPAAVEVAVTKDDPMEDEDGAELGATEESPDDEGKPSAEIMAEVLKSLERYLPSKKG